MERERLEEFMRRRPSQGLPTDILEKYEEDKKLLADFLRWTLDENLIKPAPTEDLRRMRLLATHTVSGVIPAHPDYVVVKAADLINSFSTVYIMGHKLGMEDQANGTNSLKSEEHGDEDRPGEGPQADSQG